MDRSRGLMGFIIAMSNEKGGVAKTTSTLSLGAALAELGHRVLLIDLDPQANLSLALGLETGEVEITSASVLIDNASIKSAIRRTDTVEDWRWRVIRRRRWRLFCRVCAGWGWIGMKVRLAATPRDQAKANMAHTSKVNARKYTNAVWRRSLRVGWLTSIKAR